MSAAEFLQLVSDPLRYGWLKPLTELVLAAEADDEDPRRDVELRAGEAARIAAPVEPLVMVEHEPRHRLVEAAQLVHQLASPFGMQLDDVELVVVEGTRLLEDRVGHRQLSDVVQQPAGRKAAQAGRRETEPLTELDRQHRDATRVL